MTTHPNQKDRLPTTTVIARAVRPVAIRISPAQPGPGDAPHRRGYGLPRRFAARNDRGNRDPVLFVGGAAVIFGYTGERHGGRSLFCPPQPGDRKGRPYTLGNALPQHAF